jgi:F-type H+-transporting ATPase subunit epsilon
MTLNIRIIAFGETFFDAEAEEIILPSTNGPVNVLSGHEPFATNLDIGVLRIRVSKSLNWQSFAVYGGFAEFDPNEVTVLANGADRGDQINLEEARIAFNDAEVLLNQLTEHEGKGAKFQTSQSLKRCRARFIAAGGSA